MSDTPTIALCIPAYNASAYLPRLLTSAAAQVIPFDEILVYNDCSTDETAAVAQSLGARVITGERNIGCSAGKNVLLKNTASDWIHFHDADDELLANFTTLAHRWLAKPEMPDVLLFDFEYRDNETNELIDASNFSSEHLRADPVGYAIRTQINAICGLYRRSVLFELGGYDLEPEILYNEDVAFHCKLAIAGLTFDVEKQVSIVNYRITGSMSAANQLKCLQAQHAVMRRVAAQVGHHHPDAIAQRLWGIAAGLGVYGDWDEVDGALCLASSLTNEVPASENPRFRKLAQWISPKWAFRLREYLIRILKPHLRKH